MVRALILRGPGTNCDMETGYAFEMAGAEVEYVYIDALLKYKTTILNSGILAIPGGFTYGDDLGAGTVMAARLNTIKGIMKEFVDKGNLIIGICNGFQILVKMGLLPGFAGRSVSLTVIPKARFCDQWLDLEVSNNRCVFTKGITHLYIPMANSEGRLVVRDSLILRELERGDYIALRYITKGPTCSDKRIAGLTDLTGRILGLMPHPERNLFPHSPPDWQDGRLGGEGLKVFKNAVEYFK
ncbi:phosphoribosylformylglycinamidine synthase subunit PurQ [candidate division WOR-3 bacterium]|nr:phosphoribosylformylglycinamidine synthase subunit PurQ [candidate division WOR-3 bacterium]MCK4527395.1 phosphoribosylformylglycinamidine synthase subunit PurQ [candidate division WOR-3 bacterium]